MVDRELRLRLRGGKRCCELPLEDGQAHPPYVGFAEAWSNIPGGSLVPSVVSTRWKQASLLASALRMVGTVAGNSTTQNTIYVLRIPARATSARYGARSLSLSPNLALRLVQRARRCAKERLQAEAPPGLRFGRC